jgi:hypothetical protein
MVMLGATNVQSEDDIQGNARPLPGRYHAIVKEVDESMEKVDKIIIEFEVLAGTTPGQEGRVVTEYFAVTEKAIPRLQRLAVTLGLLKPGEGDRNVLFSDAIGRDLVVEVEPNEYTNKEGKEVKTVRLTYLGFWSTGNEAVADVPKDTEAVGQVKQRAGTDAMAGQPVGRPAHSYRHRSGRRQVGRLVVFSPA